MARSRPSSASASGIIGNSAKREKIYEYIKKGSRMFTRNYAKGYHPDSGKVWGKSEKRKELEKKARRSQPIIRSIIRVRSRSR